MNFTVVIPARYASTRLPGKPLLDLSGKTMIQRVYEQACLSQAARVIVATDDERIASVVRGFGGEVCMTRENHVSGTDRLQEVAAHYAWADDAIVVNVQGDEPLIPPAAINQVAANLHDHTGALIATLCEPVIDNDHFRDPNIVKVVADKNGYALYFSRAPIPWPRDDVDSIAGVWRHIGIYAYRAGLLHDFVAWPAAPMEQVEKLEQLRAMYNGVRIHVAPACEFVPPGVDTEADYLAMQQWLQDGQP